MRGSELACEILNFAFRIQEGHGKCFGRVNYIYPRNSRGKSAESGRHIGIISPGTKRDISDDKVPFRNKNTGSLSFRIDLCLVGRKNTFHNPICTYDSNPKLPILSLIWYPTCTAGTEIIKHYASCMGEERGGTASNFFINFITSPLRHYSPLKLFPPCNVGCSRHLAI